MNPQQEVGKARPSTATARRRRHQCEPDEGAPWSRGRCDGRRECADGDRRHRRGRRTVRAARDGAGRPAGPDPDDRRTHDPSGRATYAEWLWHERTKKDSAKKIFKRYYRQPANSPIFQPPPGRPGRRDLFSFSVYIRGAMTLQALRDRVGSKTFFKIVRTWAVEHRNGNATTPQFIALAERVSHKPLKKLFKAWLYSKGKPRRW